MSGRLIIVGTPIGNLGDISRRALETLGNCDFIAAEDTRVTIKLLNHFQIKKPMISYYEHNIRERGELILQRLRAGETCALVTDAGMPSVSDPGEDLVSLCYAHGIPVTAVPGPTAVGTALALSGMPCGRFTFEGFLSVNKRSRMAHLEEIKREKRTMVFYEAPHKLPRTLADMRDALGDRKIALVKEMTKLHEEVIHTTLEEAAVNFSEKSPKGEFVLIVEGALPEPGIQYTVQEAADLARELMDREEIALNPAAKEAARQTGIKKSDIYRLLTEGKRE